METPKDFLEGYDPQIKEVGYDNYSYTPQQVIDRLEAYRKELVKESDSLPCVSDRRELLIAFVDQSNKFRSSKEEITQKEIEDFLAINNR